MTAVVVCGQHGRMSGIIADSVEAAHGMTLRCRLSLRASGPILSETAIVDSLNSVPDPPFVVVDFTAREQTAAVLRDAANVPCGLVIGTSGLNEGDRQMMAEVAQRRAVVAAPNFSIGLLTVSRFVTHLAEQATQGWSLGILDVHYAGKRDRPSATALFLAEKWRQRRNSVEAVDICSYRMGNGVSEHTLLSAGPSERLEVTHQVLDRRAFLPGVLAAIRFVEQAAPGLYSLEDVLSSHAGRPELT